MSIIKPSRSDKIFSILTLMNPNAGFATHKLKPLEVSERTKILYSEVASEIVFESSNACNIIATDNHIININQKKCVSLQCLSKK